MKILMDLAIDPGAQMEFDPVNLDVPDKPDLTADEVIASLKYVSADRIGAALELDLLAPDLCKIYVQVLDDNNRVTSRGEW